jgi:hypothetical protein
MQINANTDTSTNTKVNEIFPEVVFHMCNLTARSALHVLVILAFEWVMLKNAMWSNLVVNFDPLGINTMKSLNTWNAQINLVRMLIICLETFK